MASKLNQGALLQLIRRLHFYIGLFVGPFIFIAALSGVLYALTPQLENYLYRDALIADGHGTMQPLSQQVLAAQHYLGMQVTISSVRPAVTSASTTRVQFVDKSLGESETRAIFVNPYTLAIQGDYTVYGTSGVLPFRLWIDQLHRNLLLGDIGRIYSELAASWMWVAALGGLILWASKKKKSVSSTRKNAFLKSRSLHELLGLSLLIGMFFFSATGLTWSKWAGDNVALLRAKMHWQTPSLNTALMASGMIMTNMHSEHEHHNASETPMFMNPANEVWDLVMLLARNAGIHSTKIEIKPPKSVSKAWAVSEIDRSWPTQVDGVAIDLSHRRIVDSVHFSDYPLAAKLTRWGIDFHMGTLFGIVNQLILAVFGIGLCVLIGLVYRIWWLKRPKKAAVQPLETMWLSWKACSHIQKVMIVPIILCLGCAFPVLGASIVCFMMIDIARYALNKRVDLKTQNFSKPSD